MKKQFGKVVQSGPKFGFVLGDNGIKSYFNPQGFRLPLAVAGEIDLLPVGEAIEEGIVGEEFSVRMPKEGTAIEFLQEQGKDGRPFAKWWVNLGMVKRTKVIAEKQATLIRKADEGGVVIRVTRILNSRDNGDVAARAGLPPISKANSDEIEFEGSVKGFFEEFPRGLRDESFVSGPVTAEKCHVLDVVKGQKNLERQIRDLCINFDPRSLEVQAGAKHQPKPTAPKKVEPSAKRKVPQKAPRAFGPGEKPKAPKLTVVPDPDEVNEEDLGDVISKAASSR